MVPVSYRASPVFYVQSARFIVYDADPEVVALMHENRRADLASKVASLHGYGGADPSDKRIKEQLTAKGRAALWPPYEMLRQQELAARQNGNVAQADAFGQAAGMTLESWYSSGDVLREVNASPALISQVAARRDFAKRYDPMRSTVEHDALRRRKVEVPSQASDLRTAHPDLCAEYGNQDLQAVYETRVARALRRAGIQDALLIRNLDMVEFSFGFSRVSAGPTTIQKDRPMPVRLMGFRRCRVTGAPSMLSSSRTRPSMFALSGMPRFNS